MKNLKKESKEMAQATTVGAVEREYILNIENKNNHNTCRGQAATDPRIHWTSQRYPFLSSSLIKGAGGRMPTEGFMTPTGVVAVLIKKGV